jgi:exodeoxyribonuclease V gamma subunit
MRSIPFKVICLLGMNSDAYPRQSSPLGFDLMARSPRPGDRSQRKDDRYLFLESILSARKKLIISYVGQDIRDNSVLPPSVLVGELLDYMRGAFSRNALPKESLEIRHRLQPFSPEYFKGRRGLFSYSEKNFMSALSLVNERKEPQPFISDGLPEAGDQWNNVELDDLCRFFQNPSRFILEKRLHLHLEKRHATLEETEPFFVKGLDRYRINQRFLSKRLSGLETADLHSWARASGLLPHGRVGEYMVERIIEEAEDFAEKMGSLMKGGEGPPLNVNMDVSGFGIAGLIAGLYGERLIQYRYARLRASDRLRTWIYHLALNSLTLPFSSITAGLRSSGGKDWEAWEFLPVENAREILEAMLRVYKAGLLRPLPFFPETSLAYMESRMMKKSSHEDALGRALKEWEGSEYRRGEKDDEYSRLCFKDRPPLRKEFAALSEEIYGPMIKNQKRLEGY